MLRLIVDEFSRLQRERVSEGELASAKAYMTGSFPLTIETPDSIALQVLNVMFYGLPLEQLQTFRERVNRVTVDDIERVARFYLKPDAVSVALVGNASVFVPQLRGVGFGRFETIALENLDLLTAGLQEGGPGAERRAGLEAHGAGPACRSWPQHSELQQPRRRRRGREGQGAARPGDCREGRTGHAAGHQEHQGGDSRDDDLACAAPGGPSRPRSTTYLQYPDRVRVETKGPQGLQVQVYDGERGWVRDPGGVHDVPEAALRDMASSLKRDTVTALLAADRGELRARLLPDVKDSDGTLRHALELSSPTLEPLVLYVDPRTGLIAKQAYVVRAPGQPLVEELFSDYRPVDGVNVAFAAEVRAGGKPVVARRLNDITINARARSRTVRAPLTFLERAPSYFVRRAVRRSVRGRADS